MPVSSFSEAHLEVLRFGFSIRREIGPEAERKLHAFFAECEDTALKQIAEGGIPDVSFQAIIACWKRGIRVFERKAKSPQSPNSALQRTEAGDGAASDIDA